MSDDDYTAVHGLMTLLGYLNNNPAPGTGIYNLVRQGHALLGPKIPDVIIDYTSALQFNLFGDYPTRGTRDIVPCAIFIAVFSLLLIGHSTLFIINTSRGHYFYISIGLIFYCILRIAGFAMRIGWAQDITRVQLGIGNEVILIVSNQLIVSLNLILAQRIFTWRHPVGGSRKLFWSFMIGMYIVVVLVIAMTIVFAAIPYLRFLSRERYHQYQQVNQASSVLIIMYSLTSMSLVGLAYFFKPTQKDENLYTYQPWWIESFSPFYFVKKNAAKEAEITFMKRNHNHRHAIRVIAATHHHYNVVEGLTNQRGDLKHNTSMCLLVISTVCIFLGSLLRSIVTFQARYAKDTSPAGAPVAMYMCWGALEAVILFLYLILRVDLRFYRPDRLPQVVRSIITAEQSINVTDSEDNEEGFSHYDEDTDSETNVDYRSPEKPTSHDDDSEFRF